MLLDDYAATRTFASPLLGRTETVNGARAIAGALLAGPFYYWRKRAPVEASTLFTAELVLFAISNPAIVGGVTVGAATANLILWLGAAFLAPVLLPMCYRRKGWIEIAPL